ncbi:UNVERIFIED_CONTAM: phenylalanine--tRNA ligase subunit beta, partial [Bacillus subtilis]
SKEELISIYKRQGFTVGEAKELLVVTVPSRRGDITIEEDLVEEAAGLYGYDNIPSTIPETAGTTCGLTPYQAKRRKVRRFLAGGGLSQTITNSLTNSKNAAAFAIEISLDTVL